MFESLSDCKVSRFWVFNCINKTSASISHGTHFYLKLFFSHHSHEISWLHSFEISLRLLFFQLIYFLVPWLASFSWIKKNLQMLLLLPLLHDTGACHENVFTKLLVRALLNTWYEILKCLKGNKFSAFWQYRCLHTAAQIFRILRESRRFHYDFWYVYTYQMK